ncbi:MAG: Ig-like domain-containing protein, partial [Chloroflexota bacterium]
MNSKARHRSLVTRLLWALSLVLWLGLLVPGEPASGAAGSVALPPPGTGVDARWNASSSLQPAMIMEDFTWFAGHSDPSFGNTRMFHAVDIENGILFAATGQGLQIVDVRGGPTQTELSYIWGYFRGASAFPGWDFSDKDWFIKYLDAPAGNPNLVALGMEEQGFAIVNTSNPAAPVVAYQTMNFPTSQVYSVRAAGTDWAYALNMNNQVNRFNLTAASGLNRCLDGQPNVCPNVSQGAVSALGTGWTALHGVGNFLATGKWNPGLIKIWSLTDPAAPSQVLQIDAPAMSVAMWQEGASYYLARLDAAKKLWIHDVSCIAVGACTNAPVVWSQQLTAPSVLSLKYVTVSQAAGKTYLYLGGDDLGSCVAQREYLFDVTSPATASHDDLTPKIDPDGYWGWYYQSCPTGFNLVGPRAGMVYASTSGTHLYRAAMTILDAHLVVGDTGIPSVTMTSSTTNPTSQTTIPVTVTFSEPVINFIASDISITNGTVQAFTGSGASYSFNLVATAGATSVIANIAAGVAQDSESNPNTAAAPFSRTIDTVAPTVTISSNSPNPTSQTMIPVMVTFSESVTGFVASDISVTNGTVQAFGGGGSVYSFNLVATAGATSVTANIAAGVAQDSAGNLNTAAAAFSRTIQLPAATQDTLALYSPSTNAISLIDTLQDLPPAGNYNTFTSNAPVVGTGWVMGDWNGDGQKTPGL